MKFKSKYEIEKEIYQEISELKTLDNIFIELFYLLCHYNSEHLIPAYGKEIENKLNCKFANIFVFHRLDWGKESFIEIGFAGNCYRFELSAHKFDYTTFYEQNEKKIQSIRQDILKLEKFMFKTNGKSKFDFYYEKYNELMTGFYSLHAGLKDFNTLNFFDTPYINDLN